MTPQERANAMALMKAAMSQDAEWDCETRTWRIAQSKESAEIAALRRELQELKIEAARGMAAYQEAIKLKRELVELRAWVLEVLVRAQGAAPSPVLADAASAAHLRAADEQRARMP